MRRTRIWIFGAIAFTALLAGSGIADTGTVQTAEVPTSVAQPPSAQIIADGDALVSRGSYGAGLAKYREAIGDRALPTNLIDSVELKMTNTCERWKMALTHKQEEVAKAIQVCKEEVTALEKRREECKARLAEFEEYNMQIKNAESEKTVETNKYAATVKRRWVYRRTKGGEVVRDFGGTLPAPKSAGELFTQQGCIRQTESDLAAKAKLRTNLEAKQPLLAKEIEKVDELTRLCANDLANVRQAVAASVQAQLDALRKAEEELRRKDEEARRRKEVEQRKVQAPVAPQVPVVKEVSWWDKYYLYFIVGVSCVVVAVLVFMLRR